MIEFALWVACWGAIGFLYAGIGITWVAYNRAYKRHLYGGK